MITKLRAIKLISRIALGLVWFYEGLVPKILFLRADEIDLVRASHLIWRTPEFTLQILGVAQMLVGLWLIIGLAERTAVSIATVWMLILIGLVASGNPSMLTDPYGALVKDCCLIACGVTVWLLAPRRSFPGNARCLLSGNESASELLMLSRPRHPLARGAASNG
jgi:uncharacterized membrane protein YphA (DoxX/SURF4 family)